MIDKNLKCVYSLEHRNVHAVVLNRHELEDLDVVAVVVGNPEFVPAVVVEIGPSERTNRALFVLDSVKVELVVLLIGQGHDVSGVVAIACDDDVRGRALGVINLRVEGVGIARGHVGNSQAECVFEASRESVLREVTSHPVTGESVGPDPVGLVALLVVVYHQLFDTVAVDIGVSD